IEDNSVEVLSVMDNKLPISYPNEPLCEDRGNFCANIDQRPWGEARNIIHFLLFHADLIKEIKRLHSEEARTVVQNLSGAFLGPLEDDVGSFGISGKMAIFCRGNFGGDLGNATLEFLAGVRPSPENENLHADPKKKNSANGSCEKEKMGTFLTPRIDKKRKERFPGSMKNARCFCNMETSFP